MTADRVRHVQGLRSSNSAGPHSHRTTRAEELADALADQLDDDPQPTTALPERTPDERHHHPG